MALGPGLNGGDCTPRPRSDSQQLALAEELQFMFF